MFFGTGPLLCVTYARKPRKNESSCGHRSDVAPPITPRRDRGPCSLPYQNAAETAKKSLESRTREEYRDNVILRDKDANSGWTSAADSTREERNYYCQNWRGDVVALLTSDGKLFEQYRYSPYGVPFGSPCGDENFDGTVDSLGDSLDLDFAINNGPYHVKFDLDLNGVLNGYDEDRRAAFDGQSLARSNLSLGPNTVISGGSGGNRFGYAAYQWDRFVDRWHLRNNVLNSEVGRRNERGQLLNETANEYAVISPYQARGIVFGSYLAAMQYAAEFNSGARVSVPRPANSASDATLDISSAMLTPVFSCEQGCAFLVSITLQGITSTDFTEISQCQFDLFYNFVTQAEARIRRNFATQCPVECPCAAVAGSPIVTLPGVVDIRLPLGHRTLKAACADGGTVFIEDPVASFTIQSQDGACSGRIAATR